jgi:hypothetical protein
MNLIFELDEPRKLVAPTSFAEIKLWMILKNDDR